MCWRQNSRIPELYRTGVLPELYGCLGASSPLCYKQLGRGLGMSKHNCLVSYLLCWRRVSATVGHVQVTKIYKEENCTVYNHSIGAYFKLYCTIYTIYYDHTLYSFPLYKFLWPEDDPQWPKHVVVGIINRIQYSCFDVPHSFPNRNCMELVNDTTCLDNASPCRHATRQNPVTL